MNTVIERVRHRRDKLREAGLRPIQIWVPDTRRPGFAEECARQSRLVRDCATAESDNAAMLAVNRAMAVFLGLG